MEKNDHEKATEILAEVMNRLPRVPFLKPKKVKDEALELALEDPEEAFAFVRKFYDESTSDYQKFLDDVFPKKDFPEKRPALLDSTRRVVCKHLKKGDHKAAKKLAVEEVKGTKGDPFDFKPPVDASILAHSRDLSEMPIVRLTEVIQNIVFHSTHEQVKDWANQKRNRSFNQKFFVKYGIGGEGQEELHLDRIGTQDVNAIFVNAFNIFEGVITKVENRNQKQLEKLQEAGDEEKYQPESALNEDGTLAHPPGINPKIHVTQGSHALTPLYDYVMELRKKGTPDPKLEELLARTGAQDPDQPLPVYGHQHRINIPKGQPGYIPEHDRVNLNPQRRIRRRSNNRKPGHPKYVPPEKRAHRTPKDHIKPPERDPLEGALPVIGFFGKGKNKDYFVTDVRGPLRNLTYRGLRPKDVTLRKLLENFTKGPVLDSGVRWVRDDDGCYIRKPQAKPSKVTYSYKQNKVPVRMGTVVNRGLGTKNKLTKLTETGPVALLSVDLGQNNLVAASMCKVSQNAGEVRFDTIYKSMLDREVTSELQQCRVDYDALQARFVQEAKLSLSPEDQAQIEAYENATAETVKATLCDGFHIDPSDLPWGSMTKGSHYISTYLLDKGIVPQRGEDDDDSWYTPANVRGVCKTAYRIGDLEKAQKWKDKEHKKNKKNKKAGEPEVTFEERIFLATDKKWYSECLPRLDNDVRAAWQMKIFDLQTASPAYQAHKKRVQQACRRGVNLLVARAREETGLSQVVIALEDLNLDNKWASGSGKREPGWDNLGRKKRENRWYIQHFHKTFSEQVHHGLNVLLVNPKYTSQTCPDCGFCSQDNRDKVNRDNFVCQSCGAEHHGDLDVATYNIAKVAVTGQKLPGPEKCEGSRAEKKAGGARKAKKKVNAHPPKTISDEVALTSKNKTRASRKTVYNNSKALDN